MKIPKIELSGSLQNIGQNFGEHYRSEIHELYELHLNWTYFLTEQSGRVFSFDQILRVAKECILLAKDYTPYAYEEFQGISLGANIEEEKLLIAYMTDFIDVLVFGGVHHRFGCSSFILGAQKTENKKILLGQTLDWITDDMDYICLVHRKPDNAPETWGVTLMGSLSLVGMNSEGLSIGINNLLTWDCRPGIFSPFLVHNALRKTNTDAASKSIIQAPRASGHHYFLGDRTGKVMSLECSATQYATLLPEEGVLVHTNHALDKEIKKYENAPPEKSSLFRLKRMRKLLAKKNNINSDIIKTIFADRKGGNLAIHQDNTLDLYSTIACIIFSPEDVHFQVCKGAAFVKDWVSCCKE